MVMGGEEGGGAVVVVVVAVMVVVVEGGREAGVVAVIDEPNYPGRLEASGPRRGERGTLRWEE
ncbi:hypothetical protein E2C01_036541 [Portunus trituberculatus]|uniref:Uncharacterized protein n=1 Tax=Portunus trituberculatus TaxID=210409 RepID=A0A5B7FCR8_PORTR|nr:hypothetical protein [Portunus trituberculatus]